jgi:hypothetical protein
MTRDLQLAKRIRGDRFWFYLWCIYSIFLFSIYIDFPVLYNLIAK